MKKLNGYNLIDKIKLHAILLSICIRINHAYHKIEAIIIYGSYYLLPTEKSKK